VLTQHPDRNPGAAQEQQDLLGEGLGSVGWHSRVTGSPTDEQPPKPLDTRGVQGGTTTTVRHGHAQRHDAPTIASWTWPDRD
jgi:hypothetical protein